jgi:hypothetical protein
MSKVHKLGTISSILTGSTEWNMLFSDTRNILLQAYSGWRKKRVQELQPETKKFFLRTCFTNQP